MGLGQGSGREGEAGFPEAITGATDREMSVALAPAGAAVATDPDAAMAALAAGAQAAEPAGGATRAAR
ncbi:hypothetical protein EMIHUDRAFT_213375 [Emiliania huxleyi CCMP1516]|uniref:Uncharacterized protein n=2 Tax=Emiliania huxleyi TaxID=2903 RepID=A0A0D3IMZ9_EMIH1|nr:hypothetical protein EMIHUDRAFT_213375 [Emiliania huxleyi CCMP1516]EOD12634.1 hypothetical protein EMIHUDRAFT_213375 [Emiliania huxleyi CCMP1516]|eukprot:XP_005765063.1 hypothetical protein EMIHUDRAFT_213375 [Emiliania huxleyi CCMP1516]